MPSKDGWWVFWYEIADGKRRRPRRRLGLKKSTPVAEAKAAFALWVRAFEAANGQDQKLTIGVLMTRYIADRRKEGKNAGKMEFQWRALKLTFEHLQPADLVTEIEVAGEMRTVCHRYALEREAMGRARDTIHSELSLLRTCVSWATKRGLIPQYHIWVSTPGPGRKTALTEDEIMRLLGAIVEAPYHIRLLILIALATGARREAILDLTWDRVDFANRQIDFNTHEIKSILDTSHKKGRAKVDIEEGLYEALMHAKEFAETEFVIEYRSKRLVDPKEGVKNVFIAAGLTGRFIGLHALRHTLATSAAELGIDPRKIQRMLGHDDINTTEGVYIHLRRGFLKEVAAVTDRHIRDLNGVKSGQKTHPRLLEIIPDKAEDEES